jgi:hypothetical protein
VYFWRVDHLKQELVARSISDAGALPYLVWAGAVTAFLISMPLGEPNEWDFAAAAASAALYVAGTVYAFRRNGGPAGESFLVRYLSLSWVVAIRMAVGVGIPAIVALLALEAILLEEIPEQRTALEAFGSVVIEAAIYARIAHHVGDVARTSRTA